MKRALGYYIAWVDMLTALAIVLMLHVRAEEAKSDQPPQAQGEVRVELHWPDDAPDAPGPDVDLWVLCPGDVPVGYSNRTGGACTLDRDDLGGMLDATPWNYETTRSRGVPSGEYVVNAHLFRLSGPLPVPLTLAVYVSPPGEKVTRQVLVVTGQLDRVGEEVTLVRFTLDEHGKLLGRNNVEMPLRSAK